MLILAWLLITQSANFEIDRGPLIELKLASTFLDEMDGSSVSGGLRLSYSFANIEDAYISMEIETTYDRVFDENIKSRWNGGLNFVFYELYTPYAFRFSLGGLVERRAQQYSLGLQYRFGLGYYFHSNWGLFLDYAVRNLARDNDLNIPNEISLAVQYIF